MEHPSVTLFREYLRIKTVHPSPDYKTCTEFLRRVSIDIGLDFETIEMVQGKPIVLLTWNSGNQEPKILLNSHTDVVPVFPEFWHHDPFAAEKLENGDIVARGAQDMKCVGIMYLEAIRNLKQRGIHPTRTIVLSFVPDEEIGGADGMKLFVQSLKFKEINIGFALDEGLANEKNAVSVFYGEKAPFWVKITAKGNVGHGSQFITNTATPKLIRCLSKVIEFRDAQEEEMKRKNLKIGDVTSVNITILKAGLQYNVIPDVAEAGLDFRLPPTMNRDTFKKMLEEWTSEEGMSFKYENYFMDNTITDLSDKNQYWIAIKDALSQNEMQFETEVFRGATDSRFIRESGIPAIGITPIRNTPILLHDHNEYLNENVFLKGIKFYEDCLINFFKIKH